MVQLNEVEARVLGALIEKEITTPEYYPLSLNALVNACNQKSNREPVMQLAESEVRTALFEMDQLALVRTIADGRVSKFEHRVRDGLNLRRDEVAIVCLLLLRGPQTSAELRARSERLHSFEDNAAALATLERLAQRDEPITVLLPRQPGSREARWMHLLCGPPDPALMATRESAGAATSGAPASGLVQRLAELEELVQLQADQILELDQRLQALEARGDEAQG
jgi:uncharacterized protein YceH (UPF0502 family)